jgi:integrase
MLGKLPMKRHKFDHLHTVRMRLADGSEVTYYYHRRTRKRITGEFGSNEFLQSYLDASKRERPIGQQTLGDLIQRYRQSSDYRDKAPRTQRDYDGHLAHLDDIWGAMPIDVLDDRSMRGGIKDERDRIAERSERRADYFIQVLSIVLSKAADDGLLESNRAKSIGKKYSADRSQKIWLHAVVNRFMQVASPELRLALRLALDTGQRQGDLLLLPWNAFDGRAISLRQSKTGAWVEVPCTNELRAALNTAPRRSTLILTNSHGKPWTPDGFRSSWRKA